MTTCTTFAKVPDRPSFSGRDATNDDPGEGGTTPFPARGFEDGSLLVMDYATQIHYTHGLPKTSAAIGERISLAFRVKPDQQPPKANEDAGGDREPARMGE